jgi:hypothetical protein
MTRPANVLLLALLAGCSPADPRLARHVPEGPPDSPPPDPDTGEPDPDDPQVALLAPTAGEVVENPVTFRFETTGTGEIQTVVFTCEGYRLHEDPIPVTPGIATFTHDFTGVNYERRVELTGHDADGVAVSQAHVAFIPDEGWLPPEAGFNGYVVLAINDTALYPKDGTYPYCWSYYGDDCGDMWGQIWGGWYLGEHLFDGGEDCFCSGHTIEMFLDAYQRYQELNDLEIWEGYGALTLDDVDLGAFYQHWQGYGVASTASAANAFESAGIGEELPESRWDEATTGDFVNLSRSTGTGHSVIFVDWVWDGGERVGLRYYGCNGGGDSHPDPEDPDNVGDVSGPSFVTEYFYGHGGSVLTNYLFIGHPWDPATL